VLSIFVLKFDSLNYKCRCYITFTPAASWWFRRS